MSLLVLLIRLCLGGHLPLLSVDRTPQGAEASLPGGFNVCRKDRQLFYDEEQNRSKCCQAPRYKHSGDRHGYITLRRRHSFH